MSLNHPLLLNYKSAYEKLISSLRDVPNFTKCVGDFDGSENDIDRIGYAFEERLLNDETDTQDACAYLLARILIEQYGFTCGSDLEQLFVFQDELNIVLDIEATVRTSERKQGLIAEVDSEYERIAMLVRTKKFMKRDQSRSK